MGTSGAANAMEKERRQTTGASSTQECGRRMNGAARVLKPTRLERGTKDFGKMTKNTEPEFITTRTGAKRTLTTLKGRSSDLGVEFEFTTKL